MTEFDRERLGLVLKALRVRKSADEFIEMYEGAMDIYDHSVLTEMTFEDVMAFRPLYDFKGATWFLWKNQLIDFISKNKKFFNRSFDVIRERIRIEIDRLNAPRIEAHLPPLPCINHWPMYGGILQDADAERARRFALRREYQISPMFNTNYYQAMNIGVHQVQQAAVPQGTEEIRGQALEANDIE